MFAVVFQLYGFPMRASWLDVVILLVPYFAAVTLLGLVIAELFDRLESAIVALALTALPAVFMSGMSFPSEVQAGWGPGGGDRTAQHLRDTGASATRRDGGSPESDA
jgi:hypothetical protein